MNTLKRILFMAEAVTLAHVARPIVLARALDPDRYQVHLACAQGYDSFLNDTPAISWNISSISPQQFLDALAKGLPLYDYPTLQRYLQEDLRILEEVRPDLVVGDFRLSLAVAAPLRQIPYVNLTNACWSPFNVEQRAPFPEIILGRLLGVSAASALFHLLEPLIFKLHARAMNRLRRDNGLPPLGSLREVYTDADYTLYADVPGLVPTRHLPANHRYLGPVLWSSTMEFPAWWEAVPVNRPCVYVTFGSSGAVELLRLLLKALAALPVSVLVATAGRIDLESLPANVWVAKYLPGIAAARRSALVICNGGSATAYQALAEGVPVLGLPSNMDQFFAQESIVRAGAGRLIRPSQVTIEKLRDAVQDILGAEHYRLAARRVAEEFATFNAPERFCAFVRECLG